jgi:hypothetical protein
MTSPFKSRYLLPMIAVAGVVSLWLLVRENSSRQKYFPADRASGAAPQSNGKSLSTTPARVDSEPLPHLNESASNEELLELARAAVRRSPERAGAWAQSQRDATLRERLWFAVLRAWGELDPYAAVDWALKQNESERAIDMEATLTGAARQPDLAAEIGRELLAEDAEAGSAYGMTLIGAFGRAGNFSSAMEFLKAAPADTRADWISLTFNLWAQSRPDEAAKALATFTEPKEHAAAFQALVSGWAAGNPAGLANYAAALPPGDDRIHALNAALTGWCLQDPAAAGEWLNSLPPDPEFDKAIARLVTGTDSVNRSPEVAIGWIAGITDPELRRDPFVHVMREWAKTDSATAWNYFKNVSWFTESERENLRKKIEAPTSIAESSE